jgi:acetylglutamate kinase
MLDVNDDTSVIPAINAERFEKLKSEKAIFEGMIPKLENALEAVTAGVQKVIIGDATALKSLVEGKSGTTIY